MIRRKVEILARGRESRKKEREERENLIIAI